MSWEAAPEVGWGRCACGAPMVGLGARVVCAASGGLGADANAPYRCHRTWPEELERVFRIHPDDGPLGDRLDQGRENAARAVAARLAYRDARREQREANP